MAQEASQQLCEMGNKLTGEIHDSNDEMDSSDRCTQPGEEQTAQKLAFALNENRRLSELVFQLQQSIKSITAATGQSSEPAEQPKHHGKPPPAETNTAVEHSPPTQPGVQASTSLQSAEKMASELAEVARNHSLPAGDDDDNGSAGSDGLQRRNRSRSPRKSDREREEEEQQCL